MAGDWIKMRTDLRDDPSVVMIAELIDSDEDSVVGKLHRLWSWADKHTTDGSAPAITQKWVDRYVSSAGFASAMAAAGWIKFTDSGVLFPSFERHNGQSAKTRAEATTRKRLSRENRDGGETGLPRTAIPRPFMRVVMNRDDFTCVFCGTQSTDEIEKSRKAVLSIDHLTPITRGGSSAVENLACACKKCNAEKNDRTPEEWGLLPTFLQEGVTYKQGLGLSQESCDKSVTREEKRREEIVVPQKTDAVVVKIHEEQQLSSGLLLDNPSAFARKVAEAYAAAYGVDVPPVPLMTAMSIVQRIDFYPATAELKWWEVYFQLCFDDLYLTNRESLDQPLGRKAARFDTLVSEKTISAMVDRNNREAAHA